MTTRTRPAGRRDSDPGGPRIAVFTHDTFGLGHVRRCLHIVGALAEREPNAAILFITGSPALRIFEGLPQNADLLKIPTIARTGARSHRPPHLPLPLAQITSLRARSIREALLEFAPDVLLVDNFPLGARGELLGALRELRRSPTRVVLGLRDILDHPDVVRRDWSRQGIYDALDRYFDRILVYGVPEILDHEEAYALPGPVAERLRYCGYITPAKPCPEDGSGPALEPPFLLATGGGGGDAYPLLSAFLGALPLLPERGAAVFTGPLMSPLLRGRLDAMLNGRRDVVMTDYVPDLRVYMRAAELVVAMCGYNTAAEIIATGARALVVPRTWRYGEHARGPAAGAEWEQRMRAEALARLGRIDVLDPDELSPERLAEGIGAALSAPRPETPASLDTGGLERATQEILALAGSGRSEVV